MYIIMKWYKFSEFVMKHHEVCIAGVNALQTISQ